MVIDYADIPGKEIEDQLDHRNLNDILGVETTAENLAKWIYDRIEGCHFVEVFETCQVGVRYPAA
jgi:6-pyruvoyltetrahydropterin/6-carboxytetrahydropterin synthase